MIHMEARKMAKAAAVHLDDFYSDLYTHSMLPGTMTGPLGSHFVDGFEYKFSVIAIRQEPKGDNNGQTS